MGIKQTYTINVAEEVRGEGIDQVFLIMYFYRDAT
jgi:hypothetical protein